MPYFLLVLLLAEQSTAKKILSGSQFFRYCRHVFVPTKKKTSLSTEFLSKSCKKENLDKVVVTFKVCSASKIKIRGGSNLTKKQILQAIDGSLKDCKRTMWIFINSIGPTELFQIYFLD